MQPNAAFRVAAQGIGRFLRVIHVAQHHRWAGYADFAIGIGGQLLHGAGLDNFIEGIREWHADRAGARVVNGSQAGSCDALGGAVALANLHLGVVFFEEGIHLAL